MSRPAVAVVATLLVVASGACDAPTPEQALCAATVAMGEEIQTDDEPSRASVDTFVAAAEDVTDQPLRDPASRAATELATSPDEALDPLGEVYDRCVELGHISDATRLPAS